jgi:predicted membrane protein
MQTQAGLHWPSLLVAIVLMLLGSIAPVYLADAQGRAHHGLALLAFWAMSAGFVRGVGFIPRAKLWRWLFSGWACAIALVLALLLRFFVS